MIKVLHAKITLVILFFVWLVTFVQDFFLPAAKVLLVGLLLNPGLSLVVNGGLLLVQQLKMEDASEFHEQIKQIHEDYFKKEKRTHDKVRKTTGEFSADPTTYKPVSDHRREKTGVHLDAVGGHLVRGFDVLKETVKMANSTLLPVALNSLIATLIVHVLMPVGYLLGVYMMAKRFFF